MNAIVEQALAVWDMPSARYELVAARENEVFKVDGPAGPVALRLHRSGYRTDAELRSELEWMAAVGNGGIAVPIPISAQDGTLLQTIDGVQVNVLTWLNGISAEQALGSGSPVERAALFHELGSQMAHLHKICDAWVRPEHFDRCAWNAEGLLGEAPLWGRFWENPALRPADQALFLSFRDHARRELMRLGHDLDYGLIHADLVSVNIIVDCDTIAMIDFDDGGFGYRLFDLATALLKFKSASDYPALRDAILVGYRSVRRIDDSELDLFLALRAVTYVGWNITRMDEDVGAERNTRFIDTARKMIRAFMDFPLVGGDPTREIET